MVNIIDCSLGIDQLNQILDNLDDILLSQHAHIHVCVETQLLVDTIAAYITKVITLVREEQVLNNLTRTGIISRICVTQLPVDIKHSFLL